MGQMQTPIRLIANMDLSCPWIDFFHRHADGFAIEAATSEWFSRKWVDSLERHINRGSQPTVKAAGKAAQPTNSGGNLGGNFTP